MMKAFTVLLFCALLVSTQAKTVTVDNILSASLIPCQLTGALCDILAILSGLGTTVDNGDSLDFSVSLFPISAAINSSVNIAAITVDSASGTVIAVGAGATVAVSGAISVAAGNVMEVYGTLVADGTTTVTGASSAFVAASGSTVTFNGALQVDASAGATGQAGFEVEAGATVNVNADSTINSAVSFAENSAFAVNSGTTTFANAVASAANTTVASTISFTQGAYTQTKGWLWLTSSATVTAVVEAAVNINAGSYLRGNGNVTGDLSIASDGTVSPGNSPGTVYVNGNFALSATSTYEIDVQDANSYDRIIVKGTVKRDGILVVHLLNNYQPSHGEQYIFITSIGDQTGDFNIVRGDLNANIGNFGVTYNQKSTVAQYTGSASTAVASVFLLVIVCVAALL